MDDNLKISFYGESNLGQIRTNNEDSFVVQYIWDDKHIIAVAIDGVGGYEGGEVAADIAARSIVHYLEEYPNGERHELLRQAVINANNDIYSARCNNSRLSQMSCVLTAALVDVVRNNISMAHVGDTRLYQYCKGKLEKLSHDHSLVGFREEIGELSEKEAMNHPQRNVISRDVGSKLLSSSDDEYVECNVFPLKPDTSLLLCSDGLTDMITTAKIVEILKQAITAEDKVKSLIDAANGAGGKDNVTVVLVEYGVDEKPVVPVVISKDDDMVAIPDEIERVTDNEKIVETQKSKKCKTRIWLILLISTIVFVAGFISGIYYEREYKYSVKLWLDTSVIDSVNIHTDTIMPQDSVCVINDTLQIIDTIVEIEKKAEIDE